MTLTLVFGHSQLFLPVVLDDPDIALSEPSDILIEISTSVPSDVPTREVPTKPPPEGLSADAGLPPRRSSRIRKPLIVCLMLRCPYGLNVGNNLALERRWSCHSIKFVIAYIGYTCLGYFLL